VRSSKQRESFDSEGLGATVGVAGCAGGVADGGFCALTIIEQTRQIAAKINIETVVFIMVQHPFKR
jgi:hypothetical protein